MRNSWLFLSSCQKGEGEGGGVELASLKELFYGLDGLGVFHIKTFGTFMSFPHVLSNITS